MWHLFYCTTLMILGVFFVTLRRLVIAAVERVETREPRTLAELQFIVHLLHGDPEKVRLVTTKDRLAPMGRRGAVKLAKAKVSEEQRKKKALATIRKRLGNKLAERRHKKENSESVRLWDYFTWSKS